MLLNIAAYGCDATKDSRNQPTGRYPWLIPFLNRDFAGLR